MQYMYFVKWKDYPANENSWEPKQNLAGAQDLVRKFDAKKKTTADSAATEPKEHKKPKQSRETRTRKAPAEKAPTIKAAARNAPAKKTPGRKAKAKT
jgi:predicted RNA-binding protein with PUA domain